MKTILSLLLILSVSSSAFARIGESEQQVEARYGKPIAPRVPGEDLGETKAYVCAGFLIAVTFVDGVSQREMYAKNDKSAITGAEVEVLLEANRGNLQWGGSHPADQKPLPFGVEEWRCIDQRSRVAFHDTRQHSFFVTTQAFIDASERAQDAKTKKKLDSF